MADHESLGKRGRALEEDYFRKREQELLEKLRLRGEQEAARRELAQRSGVADQEILDQLEELGYTPDTVQLLHLVPLVQVAWAEGTLTDQERQLIIEAARSHGIDPGSAADRQLAEWLIVRPPRVFFDRTLRIIGAIIGARPEAEREASRRDLMSYCKAIASASGGILGFGKISDAERQLLERISGELERNHAGAVRDAVDGPADDA